MTFKDHCDKIIIGLILVVAIIIYYYTSYSSQEKLSGNNTKKYTVYGSMNCGWTTKQLDEIKALKEQEEKFKEKFGGGLYLFDG